MHQSKSQCTHLGVGEDFLSTDFCSDQDAMYEMTKTVPQQLALGESNSDTQATHNKLLNKFNKKQDQCKS